VGRSVQYLQFFEKMVSLTNIQQTALKFKGNSALDTEFVNYDNFYVNAVMLTFAYQGRIYGVSVRKNQDIVNEYY
jgi:hypothetical protein